MRPKIPFVPGYEVVGDVEALGPGVTTLKLGQRVAGLMIHGGYAEKLIRAATEFVPVPDSIDDATAVALILNYTTAWQAIHRIAKVKTGDTVLVTGANGGVGSAMLELLQSTGRASSARRRRGITSSSVLSARPRSKAGQSRSISPWATRAGRHRHRRSTISAELSPPGYPRDAAGRAA